MNLWTTTRLHHLRDLLAVVETGSLRAAARRLGLTQPSLSKSLRQLEELTGISLLVRSKNGVTLTTAGDRLVTHARAIESEIRRAAQDMEQLRGITNPTVSIGVSLAAPLGFLAEAVCVFRQHDPGVQLQVFEGVHERLVADVRQGVVDFALMPVGDREHLVDLRIRPLFETRVVAVGRAGHPCAKAGSLADLADCDWITPRLHGTLDRMVEHSVEELGLAPFRKPVQCDSSSMYWKLIAGSDLVGLSLAPKLESAMARTLSLRVLYDGPPLPVVLVALVHRLDFPRSALAGQLADLCHQAAAVHIGRFARL